MSFNKYLKNKEKIIPITIDRKIFEDKVFSAKKLSDLYQYFSGFYLEHLLSDYPNKLPILTAYSSKNIEKIKNLYFEFCNWSQSTKKVQKYLFNFKSFLLTQDEIDINIANEVVDYLIEEETIKQNNLKSNNYKELYFSCSEDKRGVLNEFKRELSLGFKNNFPIYVIFKENYLKENYLLEDVWKVKIHSKDLIYCENYYILKENGNIKWIELINEN